jgi:hypothetical protein
VEDLLGGVPWLVHAVKTAEAQPEHALLLINS